MRGIPVIFHKMRQGVVFALAFAARIRNIRALPADWSGKKL